jgi:hypothetical protein
LDQFFTFQLNASFLPSFVHSLTLKSIDFQTFHFLKNLFHFGYFIPFDDDLSQILSSSTSVLEYLGLEKEKAFLDSQICSLEYVNRFHCDPGLKSNIPLMLSKMKEIILDLDFGHLSVDFEIWIGENITRDFFLNHSSEFDQFANQQQDPIIHYIAGAFFIRFQYYSSSFPLMVFSHFKSSYNQRYFRSFFYIGC